MGGEARYRVEPSRYCRAMLGLTLPHRAGEEAFRYLRNIHPGGRMVLMSGVNE